MSDREVAKLRAQLAAFVAFTKRAMGDCDLDGLMAEACIRARGGLAMSHAKLLQFDPHKDVLKLRCGVGWKPGVVGHYEAPPDVSTPIGHALALAQPVCVSDYRTQNEWPYPDLLRDHACVSSINVPVRTESGAFGVLEVDSTDPRTFTADDTNFLLGLANTVAQGIQLKRTSSELEESVMRQRLLHRELNHRVKNNLGLVGAILTMRARQLQDRAVRDELLNAVKRINSLAVVHDQLQQCNHAHGAIEAAQHFKTLSRHLKFLMPDGIELHTDCQGLIQDRDMESLTLIANELVTNAAKYAFADGTSGEVTLGYRQTALGWHLWVVDNGKGLGERTAENTGFGSMLVSTLAARLGADLSATNKEGTRVDLIYGPITHQ
jgi:two-component sensor histidine kinase